MVRDLLTGSGYRMLEARDGIRGLELALAESPDLVILDLNLPGMNGFDVCAKLRRQRFTAPILVLSARCAVFDRVHGLGQGADDYLAKPFDTGELLARVQALLHRTKRGGPGSQVIAFGDVVVDLGRQTATKNGQPMAMTKTEFAVLERLSHQPGHPVSRKELLATVWGYTPVPNTRTVETHIRRLRKKLGDATGEPRWIRSLPGRGYALVV